MFARRMASALLMVLTGCAARKPATFRLVAQALVPPGVSNPALERRTFTADVACCRSACLPADGVVRLQPHKGKLRVTVWREGLARQPEGWLSRWAAREAESGCGAPGQEGELAAEIAAALPLDANAPYRLLHASDRRGFVDLGPENRLQVVSPIMSSGTPADAPVLESATIHGLTVEMRSSVHLIGYETAWYAIRPKASGAGFTLAPLYAERHIEGSVETRPLPAADYLRLDPRANFYRLVYKTGQADGVVSEFIIGAGTRAELARWTEETQALGEASQAAPRVPIPRSVAVNPFVMVTANGRDVAVPAGGTVSGALQAAGERHPGNVLGSLKLERPYRGRLAAVEFDRGSPGVLGLLLMGGERISW